MQEKNIKKLPSRVTTGKGAEKRNVSKQYYTKLHFASLKAVVKADYFALGGACG